MSVQVLKTGVVNASGEIGANLLSRYVVPGQNGPTNHADAGRTQYYGDYGIKLPVLEDADTYFRLFLKQTLTQNATYTISCNASGVLDGTIYNFPLFTQSNTSMGLLKINHNGLCAMTFTMTYSTQTPVTVGNETVYICFMDDAGRTLASGQGEILLTNFKIESGSIATPWIPANTDPNYVGNTCGYNELGSTIASIGNGYVNAPDFIEI